MDLMRRRVLRAGTGAVAMAALGPRARADGPTEIEGVWAGTLSMPQGDAAAYALRIVKGRDGQRIVRITIPAMHAFDAPIETLESLGGNRYRIDPFGSVAVQNGDRITGEFAYLRVPFALDRVAVLPDWKDTPEVAVPEGPSPRWTRALGASVWASPVARDGVVYLGDANGNVHALRVRDGSSVWTRRHGTPIYGDAAVDATGVAFVDERSTLTRLDRRTGRPLWRVALDTAVGDD
ncbi:MAG TPA: PQQ-binding-like beta-propeller repeat protein, partial [Casimicrobiaceae bacterium]|nr:PQQ-binding-like beta-propeller repeat protein [Casimicrobiaceae bacterium]